MYTEIQHHSVADWLNAFDLARGDNHTTHMKDSKTEGVLGWIDETLDEWHKIKIALVKSVRVTEPRIAHSVVPWVTTRVGRASYFGPSKPSRPAAKVYTPPPPTDPDLLDGLELLIDCGGSMAQENNPVAKELIEGGWALEGQMDKFGRKTLKLIT